MQRYSQERMLMESVTFLHVSNKNSSIKLSVTGFHFIQASRAAQTRLTSLGDLLL